MKNKKLENLKKFQEKQILDLSSIKGGSGSPGEGKSCWGDPFDTNGGTDNIQIHWDENGEPDGWRPTPKVTSIG